MISQIVDTLNDWGPFKTVPAMWQMDKHDAGFYVKSNQNPEFWIRFCPTPPADTL